MSDEDIQNNLDKYEKFKNGKPEKVLLYHKLNLENLKIISDKTHYLDWGHPIPNTAWNERMLSADATKPQIDW